MNNVPAPATRLTLVETRPESGFVRRVSTLTGLDERSVIGLLAGTGARLKELFSMSSNPMEITALGTVTVSDLVGLLKVSPELELQIIPKFLDPIDPGWGADFFTLALFSQTGRILPKELLLAGTDSRTDVVSLIAQAMCHMYRENQRRPLRVYRRTKIADFNYDGDPDPESLALPEPGGFGQSHIALDRGNDFNAVIAEAARVLLPEVADNGTRQHLLRLHHELSPQRPAVRPRPRRLPARHQRWQNLYDLSLAVLSGFGMNYDAAKLVAPGYIMRGWSTWQSLCEAALRLDLKDHTVKGITQYPLGMRLRKPIMANPDISVIGQERGVSLILDAKYKTRIGKAPSVSSSDVYECLAFLRASNTHTALLIYPRPSDRGPASPVGTSYEFERILIGQDCITAVEVEIRGISARDGFSQFAHRLGDAVRPHLQL